MKNWYQSKLVWMNVILTLIGALTLVSEYLDAGAYSYSGVVMLVVGILGVILRIWFTDASIMR